MPRVCGDRVIIFSIIGIVAWAIIGLPVVYSIAPSDHPPHSEANGKGANKGDEHNQESGAWDWLTHDAAGFFTFWLVVVGGFQLGLFAWQLWLIRKSLDDTKGAAEAAKDAAGASKAQVELARQEFHSAHRPRIRIKNIWLHAPLKAGDPVAIDMLLVNVGDAKAFIFSVGTDFNVISPDAQLPGNLEPPRILQDFDCGMGITIRIDDIRSRHPFDDERISAINKGTKILCCFGSVEYFDTGPPGNRRIRRTSFYRVFKPAAHEVGGMGRFIFPKQPDPDYEYED